jgi:hypothetical protein
MGLSFSSSKSKVKDVQAPEFKGLRGGYADELASAFPYLGQLFGGELGYEGLDAAGLDDRRAPMTPGEEGALTRLNSMLTGDPNQILADDVISRTLGGEYLSPETNPGFADLLRYTNQTISEEFDREDLAQRGLFARAGQELPESSPFAHASGELSKARMDAIGKNTAAMTTGLYESERGRMTQAVEQRRANAEFEFTRQIEGLRANALPRLIDELGFERGFSEYTARINALMAALGVTADVTAPATGADSRSSGVGVNLFAPPVPGLGTGTL